MGLMEGLVTSGWQKEWRGSESDLQNTAPQQMTETEVLSHREVGNLGHLGWVRRGAALAMPTQGTHHPAQPCA